jgi:hypothetical protein
LQIGQAVSVGGSFVGAAGGHLDMTVDVAVLSGRCAEGQRDIRFAAFVDATTSASAA